MSLVADLMAGIASGKSAKPAAEKKAAVIVPETKPEPAPVLKTKSDKVKKDKKDKDKDKKKKKKDKKDKKDKKKKK